jgi:hypothetical protein
MARNVKTDSKVEGRKEEVEIVKPAMLKAARTLRDGDTIGRLRRGFGSTQSPRPVDAMARAACFSRRQFHRLMVHVARRDTGNTPATAPIGSRRMAAINLERDRPGCRARNWIRESRDFYARISHPIWRHAIRFSQESRKDAAAINTGCTFHRTPHSSCLRKHLTRRSRQPRTASVWKSQNHTPLFGKHSPATSIPGGRKISTSRNHRNVSSLK